jgi:hypothetical protein
LRAACRKEVEEIYLYLSSLHSTESAMYGGNNREITRKYTRHAGAAGENTSRSLLYLSDPGPAHRSAGSNPRCGYREPRGVFVKRKREEDRESDYTPIHSVS